MAPKKIRITVPTIEFVVNLERADEVSASFDGANGSPYDPNQASVHTGAHNWKHVGTEISVLLNDMARIERALDRLIKKRLDSYFGSGEKKESDVEINVKTLTGSLPWHRRKLERLLQPFGMTPAKLLLSARLNSAMQLLRDTENSVSDVQDALAFECPDNFRDLFVARFGIKPSQVRRSQ